ncbi:MAG: nucleotide sugar dehydrogenase [Ignavibacteriae bacterium]|nr:nucleotide sugar dehydrogenase [Ignavibacteriota bacterium]
MNISIFGLGYVGCIGLGCLSDLGHKLIGVDVDQTKVDLINSGKATIVEKDIDDLILRNFGNNKISATTNNVEAVKDSEVAIICVGTPNNENGKLNMNYIYHVAEEIANALKQKEKFFTIAIRSTVMPGTNKEIIKIIEEKSGKKNNEDFAVVSNPEFLREGSAVNDFFNPPYTVLASESQKGINVMKEVYSKINAEIMVVDIGSAELIKLVNNTFHALKIVFANEIGRISKSLGVDSFKLMDLFVKDKQLNISHRYFLPGFAYGGSCLPKDLKALNTIAHDNYVQLPTIASIEVSNKIHIEYALSIILNKNKNKIGFYGLAFKAGTDDLRFSPALELVERLLGKGFNVKIYDKNVNLSKLMGKNRDYLFNKLPHINVLLKENLDDFLNNIDILVIVNKEKGVEEILHRKLDNVEIVDLIRVFKDNETSLGYDGICW